MKLLDVFYCNEISGNANTLLHTYFHNWHKFLFLLILNPKTADHAKLHLFDYKILIHTNTIRFKQCFSSTRLFYHLLITNIERFLIFKHFLTNGIFLINYLTVLLYHKIFLLHTVWFPENYSHTITHKIPVE